MMCVQYACNMRIICWEYPQIYFEVGWGCFTHFARYNSSILYFSISIAWIQFEVALEPLVHSAGKQPQELGAQYRMLR